ncbi:MAG TPA: hypothetical protein VMB46_00940 [Methanomassiliicoccales archaeon]|nr:hypothetical protein [Methanomassiliicoccales archaeon]
MSTKNGRAYLLVVIEPGKERDFANQIIHQGLIMDSKVERMDFVHGSYDFIIMLTGTPLDIDQHILAIRKLPHVRKTETLIPFEMLDWEDVVAMAKE